MNVITNSEKYQAMREALNEFYWDNGITPEATAAMLDTFAGEVSRLAQFIRGEISSLPSVAEQRDEAEMGAECPYCNDTHVLIDGDEERICWNCYDFEP